MGKLLIKGTGKKFMANVIVSGIMEIVLIIAGSVMLAMSAKFSPYDRRYPSLSSMMKSSPGETYFKVMGISCFVLAVVQIFVILRNIYMCKTKISVFENGVQAIVIDKNPFSVQTINLSYQDISNVSVVKKVNVMLHTSYGTYKCYTDKPEEICNVIQQIRNVNNLTNTSA